MAEYIEREQVKDELLSWAVCIKHPEHLLKEDALCVIDAIPAADVEKRVRCEDCVSSGGDRFGELICQNQLCPCYGREVDHAFSCILGERRADNATD